MGLFKVWEVIMVRRATLGRMVFELGFETALMIAATPGHVIGQCVEL